MSEKMRRSLGNKRNQITDPQIVDITRLFGEVTEGENSKVFDNEDFGYWRITVERPLRLNFSITPERIEAVEQQGAFAGLAKRRKKGREAEAEIAEGRKLQDAILGVLVSLTSSEVWKNREAFAAKLKTAFKRNDVKVPTPVMKAVLAGLSERDETADVCGGAHDPECDADLRDTENVPLKDDIHAYFEREVLPHVPDAWIDEDKTKKGYEIPFTRHFYSYTPPRPLAEIDADLKRLSGEIQAMLREIAA
jgi:type I restriction enzyme M protein